ncbi:MAG TPA: ABC transporter ATP-binding protein [Spirochaetota bacterium]|mgnify:FL=1|nr:ABC transporter ATP-binding protein [Spirochaetota bacterium]HOD16809.1 ABC transporter ATP-binding protein [Spirochaetota bacterium]HPG51716.1 ABC transporter ATP-binding protein [Spirochaetota bacterium]HPN12928.1 ABC transporter ATP-binding protein [Spirochaetota bacterium]HQL83835.1 ABC transporter ATP-binding protein [Spirochaetota bacterium]
MAEIRIIGVQKKFGGSVIIDDLDLVIGDGEFFTIVGPSGCGKSTILNMIAGLEAATGGSILFDGATVNNVSPQERDVAMVFQNYALYPHMTVFENMAFPLRMKKAPKSVIAREVGSVAGLLDLDGLLGRKPRELSGGQRQRVALGRAIIRKPRVFLMDEPLSNLDAQLRIAMRSEIKKLHDQLKTTTVYVTHDQSEALAVSDRIAVLDRGRIQQCETPRAVYERPANAFVAGFIGSPQMNFLDGSIGGRGGRVISCDGLELKTRQVTAGMSDTVTIGIRPEDITVTEKKRESGYKVEVLFFEPAGSFSWVDFKLGPHVMKGRSGIDSGLEKGDAAYMSFPVEKIHLFDRESGMRIG